MGEDGHGQEGKIQNMTGKGSRVSQNLGLDIKPRGPSATQNKAPRPVEEMAHQFFYSRQESGR